jgi:hypothetical protein
MNDDEMRALAQAVVDPLRGFMERTIALLERLTDRVEVMELEVLNRRPSPPNCTPNAPPSTDGNDSAPAR